MKTLTKTQVRILATIKLYTDKSKPKPPTITSKIIQKELGNLSQGTISSTLNSLEHTHAMVISVPVDDLARVIYVHKKAPGSVRKYYITDLGNKTMNKYLQIAAVYDRPSLYEKLFGTVNKPMRTAEHKFA